MAASTSFSSSPTGSSPTRCSTRPQKWTRASCWSSSASVARAVPCSSLSGTRCCSLFQMCQLMFGRRRLSRPLLALPVLCLNHHQGQTINLTSQASSWWCGLIILTSFPLSWGAQSLSQWNLLSKLLHPCSSSRQRSFTRSVTYCTSAHSSTSWKCMISTPPPLSDSEDDAWPSDDDSNEEEYPGYEPSLGILQPWLRVHRFMTGADPSGDWWPALPLADERDVWPVAASRMSRHRGRSQARHRCPTPSAQPSSSMCLPASASVWPPSGSQGCMVGHVPNVLPLPEREQVALPLHVGPMGA
jgi:hypothetical protein